jgi:hypothetical protein
MREILGWLILLVFSAIPTFAQDHGRLNVLAGITTFQSAADVVLGGELGVKVQRKVEIYGGGAWLRNVRHAGVSAKWTIFVLPIRASSGNTGTHQLRP